MFFQVARADLHLWRLCEGLMATKREKRLKAARQLFNSNWYADARYYNDSGHIVTPGEWDRSE